MGRGKGTFLPPPASTSPLAALAPATRAREREGNFHSLRISELAFKQNFHGFRQSLSAAISPFIKFIP